MKHTGHSRQIFHFPVRRLQTPDENATAAALALGGTEEDRGGPPARRRSRSGGRGQGNCQGQECQDLSGDHLAINWSTGELVKLEGKRGDNPPLSRLYLRGGLVGLPADLREAALLIFAMYERSVDLPWSLPYLLAGL